jgi:hypothetical protein
MFDIAAHLPAVKHFTDISADMFSLLKTKIVCLCGFQGLIRLPPSAKDLAFMRVSKGSSGFAPKFAPI